MPLSKIKKFYDNLTIGKNENNQPEMAFKNYKIAEEFIDTIHPLWHNWLDNRFQITSRAYATIIERAIEAKDFTYEELFKLTDQEAVAKILNSNNKKLRQDFKKFCKTKQFHKGNKKPTENKFIVPAFPVKVRYIDPLFSSGTKYQRLSSASKKAKQYINEIKDYPVEQYA